MAGDPANPKLLELFAVFARIGAVSIGGGYVMLPLMRREMVEVKGWLTTEEIVDYYALGQSVPGIIAMNTATLVGYRKRGLQGAVAAAAGMAVPSLAVILLIAAFCTRYLDLAWVQRAFAGIRAAVVAMVAMAVWDIGRKSVNNVAKTLIATGAFTAIVALNASPVLLIIAGALLGLLLFRREEQE